MTYTPLYIKGMETGLVQSRQNFILPDDAYPVLQNAYVWRERLRRKQGSTLLGRLKRDLESAPGISGAGTTTYSFNAFAAFAITEPNAQIVPGSFVFTIGPPDTVNFTDDGAGGFIVTGQGTPVGSSINYVTGAVTIVFSPATTGGGATLLTMSYYPGLPVMGLLQEELTGINVERCIAFDTTYAYRFSLTGWTELIPGTTWTGNNSDFFWGTNYWVDAANRKLFWVTNNSRTASVTGDPIRYTDTSNTAWFDFAPVISGLGSGPATEMKLYQCLALLPFRGRFLAFNTWEGTTGGGQGSSLQQRQRIRWSQIGTPLDTVVPDAWVDDIRGKGGFLDIPTAQDIVAVGFVRDNLVIYCESSTWQLKYTGRSIQPFQIEKVNSEFGAESTFSAIQFDTSLVGIGDKGVIECDSYKSDRIDIKIPDLVFQFDNDTNGPKRVHGIRNFPLRLAYWTYPYKPVNLQTGAVWPNRRLVYNYENDSWAIFTDSLTTLGTFQATNSRRWRDVHEQWQELNVPWIFAPSLFPSIIGGNQQGYVVYLDQQTSSDVSLRISNITGGIVIITSPDHNLERGTIIQIVDIPTGTSYDSLNEGIYYVQPIDIDTFNLYSYDPDTLQFSILVTVTAPVDPFVGYGQIKIRDNFIIQSKKFNFLDEGQTIQLGYLDILFDTTTAGEITLNVYEQYSDIPSNQFPENTSETNPDPNPGPDTFFNTTVPTSNITNLPSSKNFQRVFCPVRSNFITIEWTLSNEQMTTDAQESDVEIDTQILWLRRAGKQLNIGSLS